VAPIGRKPFIPYQKAGGGKGSQVWYAAFWSPRDGKYIRRTSTRTVDEDQAGRVAAATLARGIVPT
jgi:hypothetical protein